MKVAEPPMPPAEVPAPVPAPPQTPLPGTHLSAPGTSASVAHSATPTKTEVAKSDTQKPVAPAATSHSDWVVQVESFKSKENADREVSKFKSAGYSAFLVNPRAPALLYSVRIGPFVDRVEADKTVSKLIKEGYKPFLTR